jgi:hypothetical protein
MKHAIFYETTFSLISKWIVKPINVSRFQTTRHDFKNFGLPSIRSFLNDISLFTKIGDGETPMDPPLG